MCSLHDLSAQTISLMFKSLYNPYLRYLSDFPAAMWVSSKHKQSFLFPVSLFFCLLSLQLSTRSSWWKKFQKKTNELLHACKEQKGIHLFYIIYSNKDLMGNKN